MIIFRDLLCTTRGLVIVVVANDLPGAATTLAVEGSQTVRRHPLHVNLSSLVDGGVPRPLVVQSRSLKILILLLLLLDYPISPTPHPRADAVPSLPRRRRG